MFDKTDKLAGEEESRKCSDDIALLNAHGYSNKTIAEGMGMQPSNFSTDRKKINKPIKFLKRFYKAWGKDIDKLKESDKKTEGTYNKGEPTETVVEEQDQPYSGKNDKDILVAVLLKNNDALIRNIDKIVESNRKLTEIVFDSHESFKGQRPANETPKEPSPDESFNS